MDDRSQSKDRVSCVCGVLLDAAEVPSGLCHVCRPLEMAPRPKRRRRRKRLRHTPPDQRLAASYARLRAQRTGADEDPREFLEDARRDLARVQTRVALAPPR